VWCATIAGRASSVAALGVPCPPRFVFCSARLSFSLFFVINSCLLYPEFVLVVWADGRANRLARRVRWNRATSARPVLSKDFQCASHSIRIAAGFQPAPSMAARYLIDGTLGAHPPPACRSTIIGACHHRIRSGAPVRCRRARVSDQTSIPPARSASPACPEGDDSWMEPCATTRIAAPATRSVREILLRNLIGRAVLGVSQPPCASPITAADFHVNRRQRSAGPLRVD